MKNETVVWISRILLLVVGGVFVDTLMRLHKLDETLHERHDHHHSPAESTIEDLQYKTKLFYSQRNMYLSVMSLFMVVRFRDIYEVLHLQEKVETDSVTLKAMKQQIELLINATPGGSSSKDKVTSAPKDTPEKEADPKPDDPIESSGIRKRGAGKKE
ncbi:hypothetical protein HDU76_001342 [Blyttiomyces sp. JEL0837]|nr:hypothetical protein HDU76_001342 [Blyttiomyces sp. JEL0837]